jgi:hypothetical protein
MPMPAEDVADADVLAASPSSLGPRPLSVTDPSPSTEWIESWSAPLSALTFPFPVPNFPGVMLPWFA